MRVLELAVQKGVVNVRSVSGGLGGQPGEILTTIALQRPLALPIMKWAGGKQWLGRIIHTLVPERMVGRYYEPFLGGGSVFFALNPRRAVLADVNANLVNTYKAIAEDVEGVISELGSYHSERCFYEAMRKRRPRKATKVAARMIYLNKTAWNGLYRVNRKGEFNVPFGKFTSPTLCHSDRLRIAAAVLRNASLKIGDFEVTIRGARDGDLVYFDPPYTCSHGTNGFLKYNARLFAWKDQIRLARAARRLTERGVHVIVSNAGHRDLIQLYEGSDLYLYGVERNDLIGGGLERRGRAREILISSFPLKLGVVSGSSTEIQTSKLSSTCRQDCTEPPQHPRQASPRITARP